MIDYGFLSLPGWFGPLDAKLLSLADAAQRATGVEGDLLEIGTYVGRSAVLLGSLKRDGERFVVSDIFAEPEINEESAMWRTMEKAYTIHKPRVDQFRANYLRFHATLPEIRVGPSSSLDPDDLGTSFRLIHVDGAHDYENVVRDLALTREVAGPGAIVAFDDIAVRGFPGVGAAIWPEVESGRLRPLLAAQKLYATWDIETSVADVLFGLVGAEPRVEAERCRLADFEALVVWQPDEDRFMHAKTAEVADWKLKSKLFLRDWTPPVVWQGAKKVRAAL